MAHALISYVRATVIVALVDAIGIGIGLAVLGVPLVIPLAALVFLGAFIPIIGSFLAGTVAVLVALLTVGPIKALIAFAIVVLVMQLEGTCCSRCCSGGPCVHPLAVVLAIAAGLLIAGIFGALIAVPTVACVNWPAPTSAAATTARAARASPGSRPACGHRGLNTADPSAVAGRSQAASSPRLRTPVLAKIDLRWSCTVWARDEQVGGDLGGRVAGDDLPADVALARAQAVRHASIRPSRWSPVAGSMCTATCSSSPPRSGLASRTAHARARPAASRGTRRRPPSGHRRPSAASSP